MLLIVFVHPLFGETGDALGPAAWVFEQMGTVSGP
jgi:predicted NodU family carbamoyl transferase